MSRSIKELCPTVVDAVQAMIDGLKNLPDDNLRVDMETFGAVRQKICYGCAATFAVMQAAGKKPQDYEIPKINFRAYAFELDADELNEFEWQLDLFRIGAPSLLLSFYGIYIGSLPLELQETDWYLTSENYLEELKEIEDWLERFKEYLKENGNES